MNSGLFVRAYGWLLVSSNANLFDTVYKSRHFQRFWVLEVITRATYFAFLSVLHFNEYPGLRTAISMKLMKDHFSQAINETEHL